MRIASEGTYEEGEYVPGPAVDFPLWSQQRGAGSADQETLAGIRVASVRSYMIRYFPELARATPDSVSLVDADGDTWNVESIDESDQRRRFLNVTAIREVV